VAKSTPDQRITKRRVTLVNSAFVGTGPDGRDLYQRSEVVDYVPDDVRDGVNVLEAYLAAVRPAWQSVTVSEEFDAGPAGYEGQTYIPDVVVVPPAADGSAGERRYTVQHPAAGRTYDAETAISKRGGGSAPDAGPESYHPGGPGFIGLQALILTLGLGLASAWMPIQTATRKNLLATAYANDSVSCALYSTVPGASAGTELTGGSPAYARIAPAWGAPANGVVSTGAMTFNVASGSTVAGFGLYNSGAVYQDGASLTSQAFASQGTYALTITYTQT
jgi:hypothetical protein